MVTAMSESSVGRSRHDATHYPLFDYLRILLATGVFFRHALGDNYLSENFGNACVQIFFGLSGFLIGTILLDTAIDDLPSFYFKRVVRIWIPYAIAISLLMTGTILLQNLRDPVLWQTAFYNVTFVTNVFHQPKSLLHRAPMWGVAPHFWSICVEEQFYLLAPLLMLLLKRARVPILIGVAVLNVFVPHNFASVSLGVLLAIATAGRPLHGWARLSFALVAISTVLAVQCGWVKYAAVVPVGAVALVAALAWPGRPSALGSFLGGMSYPFYLNHWLPLMMRSKLIALFGVQGGGAIALAFAASLAGSAVHYGLIDRQVLRARSRWYTAARGRIAWATGFSLVALGLVGGVYFHEHNLHDGTLQPH